MRKHGDGMTVRKKKELLHEDAKFLYAFDRESRKPLGFINFRWEYEEDVAGCFIYEMQMESLYQSKGVGKFMSQLLELICIKYQMSQILLTVFIINERARNFYLNKMKFEVHESSPSKVDPLGEYDYDILCKKLPQTRK